MGTNLSISNFKKLPWPFITALLAFTLLQIGLEHSAAFWRYVERNCRFHFEDVLHLEAVLRRIPPQASFKKVLVFGTSQTREGIDFAVLNEHFKDRNIHFYDLGVIGSFFPIENFMLKERILAVRPDVVIYNPFVESFYRTYKEQPVNNLEFWFNPTVIPYLAKHLRWEDYDKEFRGELIDSSVGSLSLFYRYRHNFSFIFFASFKYALGLEERPPLEVSFFKEPHPQEYYLNEIEAVSQEKEARYRYTNFTPLNQELFTLFAKEMVAHDVKLIVINLPVHPLMSRICSPQIMQSYHDFLSQQAQEIGFSYLHNKELPNFTQGQYNDFTHLTLSAREQFTKFLAGYLERELEDLKLRNE